MLKVAGFLISFVSCYLILSIPVKNEKLIFHYVHSFSNPYLQKTYQSVKRLFAPKIKENTPDLSVLNSDETIDKIKDIINESKKAASEKVEEAFDDYDFRSEDE